jgi:hypothetical protein
VKAKPLPCGCLPHVGTCEKHRMKIPPLNDLQRRRHETLIRRIDAARARLAEEIAEERRANFRVVD